MKRIPEAVGDTSLLELIFETAPDAIVTADANGVILSFSPAAERIFGFAETEVIGRNVSCLMPEPYRSEHDGYMEHYLETGEKRIIGIGREVRARRKSGEIFVAELAVGELKFGDRRIFTGFVRDASGRAKAERRARDLQIRLERVARIQMLGEMSAAMAHEINQPLAAISNFAKAAERALGSDAPDLEAIASHVAAIVEQSMRAGEIIRKMRRMVERGAAEIRPEDINDIIADAVRVGRMNSLHGEPEVHLDLGQDLPKVMADSVQIQQVLLNLMWNSFEALTGEPHVVTIESRRGRGSNRIVLSAGVSGGEIVVSVIDTGPGIPDEVLEKIFDPLVTTKETGLGVGLAVCRSIITAHGGRIWAENIEGGAVFSFTLPVVPESAT